YVDGEAASKFISIYSEKYTALLAFIISCRFYHGYSHYTLSENWIASVSEKVFGNGLASKVDPEKIMEHKYAACSQQAIVMMAVLRKKNISYRKVGFPHHYALEARINSKWYFFDPNMEPAISLGERLHENWNGSNDHLKKYYTKHGNVNWEFGSREEAVFGVENEIPGQNAKTFQSITKLFSKILWCFPLVFAVVKRRRGVRMYAVKPINHFEPEQNLTPVFPLKYYF
ncbi:MAG: hypothetical protein ABIT58_05530, partial [Ferruginibacter sp.]